MIFIGRLETPCVMYHDTDTSLILEILDVRRVSWPEPGPKVRPREPLVGHSNLPRVCFSSQDNSNWPKKSSAKTALVVRTQTVVAVKRPDTFKQNPCANVPDP
jgi:hypothetical protein